MSDFEGRDLPESGEAGEKKGLTRRGFLGAAAVTGVAAGVGSTLFGSSSAMAAGAYSTVMPKTWNKTYDVVVIGTGCGFGAAIEAKEAGASVCMLEAADHVGGLYITAGGSFTMGGNNIVQQAAGVTDSSAQWFADEMYTNDWRAQPEVVQTLVDIGAETVKWFNDLGIVYAPLTAGVLRAGINRGITALPYNTTRPLTAGAVDTPNPVPYPGGSGTPNTGISFTWVMYQKALALKIPIMLNTAMNKIYRDADGMVRGVRAKTKAGKLLNIKARKGVIICAGTWTDNQAMMQQYDNRTVGQDCYGDGGTPTDGTLYVNSAGDGIRYAQQIGAAAADLSFSSYIYIFFGARSYWGWGHDPIDWTKNTNYAAGKGLTIAAATMANTIMVNNSGKRFVNESLRTSITFPSGRGAYSENPENAWTDAILETPQPRNIWMIGDATTATALAWPLTSAGSTALSTIDKPDPKTGAMFDPDCIAIAQSLSDLAQQMGVDADALATTVANYNTYVTKGTDADFAKPMTVSGKAVNQILTAPFYGLKASLIRHTQRNGLRCNTKMQVIEEYPQYAPTTSIDKLKTIPHLFVAGESGDILGWRRGHNTLAHYVSAARIAGQNAAKNKAVK